MNSLMILFQSVPVGAEQREGKWERKQLMDEGTEVGCDIHTAV